MDLLTRARRDARLARRAWWAHHWAHHWARYWLATNPHPIEE
jgi:hypothetical protein